ncbi:hypothetical protein KY495_20565 [Massilia sp. PAMC28688]|uniref:hypothetical protein n=1 Tax=Massilia sp. PAMC28688 TaxID=2861283 RepID=UPI001C6295AF|nr:hypothetical protein [Massilia sp. PAMC28688]QYF93063.1 hypothetical protein KY495_20565 [Massilia sp. PAMC28688]
MKRARIVVETPYVIPSAWCWRDDWNTGYDSPYGLFSKFARLNAMGARELAEVFIDRDCGKRGSIVRFPKVDLRSSALFDKAAFAKHLRLDPNAIEHAFVVERLVNRRRRSSDVLRWCARCARYGFHSATYQLDLISACPVHSLALRSRCPRCRSEIPYILTHAVFAEPFCCPSCSFDLAPSLREVRPPSLKLRGKEEGWIDNLVSLFVAEDEMVPVRLELNRKRKFLGIGEFAISHADWRRLESEYTGFVRQVVGVLEAERPGVQLVLPLGPLSVSTKRFSGKTKLIQVKSVRRYKSDDVPIDQKTSAQVKRAWDGKMRASYAVYSGVRRSLWRHVVHDHQTCITSAAAHFWWNMDGESTAAFCPVAEAFIRWRMHWESCGTPRYLFAPMRKDPMGLGAWLGAEAPICPPGWTTDSEQWVSDHVLGSHCLGSFWEFLEKAIANAKRNKIAWSKHSHTGRYTSYWAVTGRDTRACPVRIYEQVRPPSALAAVLANLSHNDQHRKDHQSLLAAIVR